MLRIDWYFSHRYMYMLFLIVIGFEQSFRTRTLGSVLCVACVFVFFFIDLTRLNLSSVFYTVTPLSKIRCYPQTCLTPSVFLCFVTIWLVEPFHLILTFCFYIVLLYHFPKPRERLVATYMSNTVRACNSVDVDSCRLNCFIFLIKGAFMACYWVWVC